MSKPQKKHFAVIFFTITALLFLANLAIIIVFTAINMEDNFYNSLNVASLSISFLSFIASSFFSLSVYLQSKAQSKINDSLPKKDDQYIIANYSLFNIEKEISFFSLVGDEKKLLFAEKKYLEVQPSNKQALTRIVFLPSESVNATTYKAIVKSIEFYSSLHQKLFSASCEGGIDCDYAPNILQRNYNCICVDIAEDTKKISDAFSQSTHIELRLDIISVFNVKMSVKFSIRLNESKNLDTNPDKQSIKDLETYFIHHCNYVIEEKSILK